MNKILLLKTNGEPVIRKNGATYTLFEWKGLVNKNNEVYAICFDNYWGMWDYESLPEEYQKKIKKHNPSDKWFIFLAEYSSLIETPYKLSKPVRGLRFASMEEERKICELIVETMIRRQGVQKYDAFWGAQKYKTLYSYCVERDLLGSLIKLEQEGKLL